ncbi:MAG TPA: helix-turn-helix domain-containing protein [Herpetosiphonaceae bacterium]
MPIRCTLALLMARATLERRKRQLPKMTLRVLAAESGISLSALAALSANKNTRLDYATLEKVLLAFNQYFPTTIGDILVWEQDTLAP